MELKIIKKFESSEETLSDFYIDNTWFCHALEDQGRPIKVKGDTRIPEGRYEIKLRKAGGFYTKYLAKWSSWLTQHGIKTTQKFIGSLHVTNVPNFEYILIHIGNTDKDTAGCILVGTGYTETGTGKTKRYTIKDSTKTFLKLYDIVADELEANRQVYLTVKR